MGKYTAVSYPPLKSQPVPFALPKEELLKMQRFCESNGLEELAKVCAELVVLREEFLMISKRYAMLNNAWNATLQDKGVINAPPQP